MAWTKVEYDTRRQDQTSTTYNPDDQSVQQQTIQTYIAVNDDQTTEPIQAETASAGGNTIPVVGNVYTIGGQAGFLLVRRMPKRTSESPFVFEIQCEFQRKWKQQPAGTPAKWATDISVTGQKFTQDAYQDKDAHPVVNTAGQAYDPSVPRTRYDEVISISYNTLSEDSAALAALRGKVNSGACSFNIKGINRSFTARQLLLDDAQISTSYVAADNTTPIYKVSLVFIARADTFADHILDQGFYQLVGGVRVPIYAADGVTQLSAPAQLDAAGAVLAPGATPHYSTFKIEDEVSFTSAFSGL